MFFEHGLPLVWREMYISSSHQGVIRGMHFQIPPHDHNKLVCCIQGRVWDVVVDLRCGSPTYGKYFATYLDENEGKQLLIPKGCAHGFLSLSDQSMLVYAVDSEYSREHDKGIRWDSCNIAWPLLYPPILSDRDQSFPALNEFVTPFVFGGSACQQY